MDKLLSLLGMCRKANKLSCGHDGAVGAVRSGKAKLCLLSSDSSDRLKKEAERETEFKKEHIPIYSLKHTMNEIGNATGLKSAILTVDDEGFAKAMLSLLNTETEVNA